MRWLVTEPGPSYSVLDVYNGWVEALRNAGERVAEHPLSAMLTFYDNAYFQMSAHQFRKALSGDEALNLAADRLAGALYKVRPDVLLVVSGFFTTYELLDVARHDGVKVVAIGTESPYEDDRQLEMAEHCDLFLVDDPTNLEAFRAVTRAEYMPKAYRPSLHCPGPVDPVLAADLAFVGTGYPSRMRFFEDMNLDGLDVLLAGNWTHLPDGSPLQRYVATDSRDCLDNEQVVPIYRSAKVGLNLYRREGDEEQRGWAMGPRELELAACGAFFLRDPRGEGDEVLDMLPTFSSAAEASALVREWLPREDERAALATKARAAIADRTFDHNAARLLRLLDA